MKLRLFVSGVTVALLTTVYYGNANSVPHKETAVKCSITQKEKQCFKNIAYRDSSCYEKKTKCKKKDCKKCCHIHL